MPKFKSTTGYPVHIGPGTHKQIEVPYYAPHYETDDPDEVAALEATPEVMEVAENKGGSKASSEK